MSESQPSSPWRIPLVREIIIILIIKLAIMISIKNIWFTEPVVPKDGIERVSERLLGANEHPSQPLRVDEEETSQ